MATDYKIVVVPDTGGTRPCTRPCIECPQCLGLYNYYLYSVAWQPNFDKLISSHEKGDDIRGVEQ